MHLTDQNYTHELLQSTEPVVLFFYATFCGPSTLLLDFVGDAKAEFEGVARIVPVDVEECPRMAHALQIKGTPTVMLLDNGTPIASRIGTSTYDQFCDWIEDAVKKINEPETIKGGKKK